VLDQLEKNLTFNSVEARRATAIQLDWTLDLSKQEDVVAENLKLANIDLILATGKFHLIFKRFNFCGYF
jgi:hypothetical protein